MNSLGRCWIAAALVCACSLWASSAFAQGQVRGATGDGVRGGPVPVVLLAQDWTDTDLITTANDWSGVLGIIGYRGDGMAGGTAVDPQAVLADGSDTPVNVIANQTNPNTLTTGGVAEFHIADPVVALQGSGTARAPHLVLTLDTTGLENIQVAYLLRDVDGSADNAVQPVALHYRVGGAGNYINLPEGFVPDASTGPNLAVLETPVDVTLPADANDQPLVEVRILTTDAVGSDEWIGIDDILVTGTPISSGPSVRITEWMYNPESGGAGEFVELTNVGDAPVDLAGWSYDDDSAIPGVFDLSGFGVVQPGESVVLTELSAAAFRTEWSLCEAVKVVGNMSPNLGRNDQINIYDADHVLVDRLTYGDQTFPGSIRTVGISGWVTSAGLGADDVYEWHFSVVGDAEGSWQSATSAGGVGSPGKSTHGGYDPCDGGGPGGEVPTIQVLPAIQIGSIADPTNPPARLLLADADSSLDDLVVTVVSSSNPGVLPAASIVVAGAGDERLASFQPTGRGVSNVVFRVTDPDGNQSTATLIYASSNQAPDSSGRYHHQISDASAALDVGDGYVILVNDEHNTLFLHRQEVSGPPVKTWAFSSQQLGTSSEIDFEGIARSGDLLVITGSHGNNRSGEVRVERRTLVAASIAGTGADTELTFLGRYNNLWAELRAWDQGNGHGLGADALGFIAGTQPGVEPNPPGGFNIEALEFAPDGQTLYLGFRAPTVNVGGVRHALIVPVLNIGDLVDGAPGTGPAQFGTPILLDLDGRSIRSLASTEHGEYLISAGPSPQNDSWALYTWDGDPEHVARFNRLLPAADLLTGGPWEGIVAVPHPLAEGAVVRLVTDSGDTNFYGTGQTKDLAPAYQKSYSQTFVLAAIPVVEYTVTVDLEGAGHGSVIAEGIDCPSDCDEVYAEGTALALTASAQPGSFFAGWGGACSGTDECQLTVNGDRAVTATFLRAASLAISPQELSLTLIAGQSQTEMLSLANLGDELLDWQVAPTDVCALADWAELDPGQGTIEAGAAQQVTVLVDTAGVAVGDSSTFLCFASNDPVRPVVRARVLLTVLPVPAPVLGFDPSSLDFGSVELGAASAVLTASLRNDGDADATGLDFSSPGGGFAVDATACGANLIAGASCQVGVTFTPSAAGPSQAIVTVASAEATSADLELAGTGVEPPDPITDLTVNIHALHDHVQHGALLDYEVIVTNLGPDAAHDVSVASALPPDSLDVAQAQWLCVQPAGSGCTGSGQGNLVDGGLSIPAGGEVVYVLSVPVLDEADGVIETTVQVEAPFDPNPDNNQDRASTTVVIYRDGFELDSESPDARPLASVAGDWAVGAALSLHLPEPAPQRLETVLAIADAEGFALRVERLNAAAASWLRLVSVAPAGGETASAWLSVQPGIELVLAIVDHAGADGEPARTALLFAGEAERQAPLAARAAIYRLWSVAPVAIQPVAAEERGR